MKSFRFRLQTLLEQRERQEKVALQSVAEAEEAVRRAEQLLSELQEVRAALLEELCARRGGGGFDPMETRLYQEYMQVIAQSIREQEAFLRDLATTREARKLHLVSTSQGRQALMTVKERDLRAHVTARQRAEQGVIDEMATARYNHRQRGQE